MLNLLYCIDENYNKQAYISIASILENTSQEINVYIIHKSPTSFKEYRKKLIHSENLNNFSFHLATFEYLYQDNNNLLLHR